MYGVSNFLFIVLLLLTTFWGYLIYKNNSVKSIYFIYFCLNFTVFVGPILYYKLGYTGYSSMVSTDSLLEFYYLSMFFFVLNILLFALYKNKKSPLLFNFLKKIKYENITNRKLVKHYYIVTILIAATYIIVFHSSFPLVILFDTGQLGDRLDATGEIPMYITFSSAFVSIIPSAFFYYRMSSKSKILKFLLFLFTIFCLSAGGNKGIVSFFLIFYVLFCTKGLNLFKYGALFVALLSIYAVLKGVTQFNQNTFTYLTESPFRRLFAAQGAGYIARIEMINHREFTNTASIKQQVYNHIYGTPVGSGSSPTHFTGDLLVTYGYPIMILSYIIFSLIFLRLINTADFVYNSEKDAFILWGFFVIAFLACNSDVSLANIIRVGFVIFNLGMIKFASRLARY